MSIAKAMAITLVLLYRSLTGVVEKWLGTK